MNCNTDSMESGESVCIKRMKMYIITHFETFIRISKQQRHND